MKQTFGTFVGHVPDLMAAVITILMTILLATGVKKSLMFNNILNLMNFFVWVIIVCSSLFFIDFDNWSEHGGFVPYGWTGMLNGAATCFYAFIGFDIIATTGEEAENPERSIPTAIITSLAIALTAYTTSGESFKYSQLYSQNYVLFSNYLYDNQKIIDIFFWNNWSSSVIKIFILFFMLMLLLSFCSFKPL